MSWTRLAASGFTAAILLFAMSFISWFAYIDIVGFALISIVAPLVWWTVSGPRIPHLFRTLRTPNASTAHVRAATTTARSIRRWIWAVPAYGASLGIISLCTYLDDPAAIGPALAVSILVPLYATIADLFVASPLIASLESRPSPSPAAAVASIPSGAPTMMFSRIVAGALAAFFLVAAILVGSPLGVFIDIVSFLITIVGGGFAWLAMSGAGIGRLRDTLRADAPTQEALAAAQLTVKQGRRAVWLTGIAGTGIGGCIGQMARHAVEHAVKRGAHGLQRADRGNRDQCGNKAVFDGGGAGVVLCQGLQKFDGHCTIPFTLGFRPIPWST